jgi:hypothetical protein
VDLPDTVAAAQIVQRLLSEYRCSVDRIGAIATGHAVDRPGQDDDRCRERSEE